MALVYSMVTTGANAAILRWEGSTASDRRGGGKTAPISPRRSQFFDFHQNHLVLGLDLAFVNKMASHSSWRFPLSLIYPLLCEKRRARVYLQWEDGVCKGCGSFSGHVFHLLSPFEV